MFRSDSVLVTWPNAFLSSSEATKFIGSVSHSLFYGVISVSYCIKRSTTTNLHA